MSLRRSAGWPGPRRAPRPGPPRPAGSCTRLDRYPAGWTEERTNGARAIDCGVKGAEQDDHQRNALGRQRLEPDSQLLQGIAVASGPAPWNELAAG